MPDLVRYIVSERRTLGPQLSPTHQLLALRAACPVAGCGLSEKTGLFNVYTDDGGVGGADDTYTNGTQGSNGSPDEGLCNGTVTFHCPHHGPYTLRLSSAIDVARLEADVPTRNLLQSMTHLLDTSTHHVRVTSADYAGTYQETLVYRPLAAWSAAMSERRFRTHKNTTPRLAATAAAALVGRTPHILYAPLIVDWSGSRFSKSLYMHGGTHGYLEKLGMNALCSYAQLKAWSPPVKGGGGGDDRNGVGDGKGKGKGKGHEQEAHHGLRRLWGEVKQWVADPKKQSKTYSLAYLQNVMQGVVVDGC
ncbi:hypothetical protein F5Y17DRAFT_413348 [Xylariaceae sp. FL0594]|nr:hypothetical protein F5Y17DRAFT_413348 [Xylariaceae sp. FL0594]